ncbi:hypothetical protein SAMN05421676_106240 [Salinibacillus kushneri]|uniref:Membrane protein YczE n=1 Tax=Salinibacillus kushneri TaxID=237682 RepID=A0A1I0G6D1_9BACI|nr:YitT family protein [Salinibacillus kushneri]SET66491.1 hypothetical protein SAMN05421676_106240 [Salinibacillus kushneri]
MSELTYQGREHLLMRWFVYFVGIIILAFGISLTIKAKDLGISPWDVLHYGLFSQFGLTVGSWSIIVGIVIVSLSCMVRKTWPQIGTIFNMVFMGIFIDIFLFILPDPGPLWMDFLTLMIGLLIAGYGIGLYVAAKLGAGPRDTLMLLLTEKTGWKVQWVRIGLEILVFIVGYFLGGPIGIGTVIASVLLGSIVGYSLPQSERLLKYMIWRRKTSENFNEGTIRLNHYD